MTTEEAARVDAAEDQVPEEAPDQTGEQDERTTEEHVAELEERLTNQGRKVKRLEDENKSLKETNTKAKEANDGWRQWFEGEATEEQKDKYRKTQEKKSTRDPEVARLSNENALLKAIAAEENPAVKKALQKLYSKVSEDGRFPESSAIEALRESLSEGEEEPKKAPPAVSAVRGTRGALPDIDSQIKEAQKGVKTGKVSMSDLLGLLQQKQELSRSR